MSKFGRALLVALLSLLLCAGSAGAASWSAPSLVPTDYAGSYALAGDGTLYASSFSESSDVDPHEVVRVRAPGGSTFAAQDTGLDHVFGQVPRTVKADEDSNAIYVVHDVFFGAAWLSYKPVGGAWTPMSTTSTSASWFETSVRKGRAVAAWGEPGGGGVKFSQRNSTTGAWSTPIQLAATPGNATDTGAVLVSTGGDVTVSWRDSVTGAVRQKSRVSNTWGADQALAPTDAYKPSIAMSNDGSTTVAWNRNTGSGATFDYPAPGYSTVDEEDLHSFAADPPSGESTTLRGSLEVATRGPNSTSFAPTERHFHRVVNLGGRTPLAVAGDGTTAILAWRGSRLYILRRGPGGGEFQTRRVESDALFDGGDVSTASIVATDSGFVTAFGSNEAGGAIETNTRRYKFDGTPATDRQPRGPASGDSEVTLVSNFLGGAVLFWPRGASQSALVYDGLPVSVHDVTKPASVHPGVSATFSAQVAHGLPTITWAWGDGTSTSTSQSGQNRTHTFAQPGRYHVTATATDADGGTDTEQFDVIADAAPPQVIVARPLSGQHFSQSQTEGATADFVCTDDVELASCTASTADGQPLPTGTAGSHVFHVTAFDAAGQRTDTNITYFVDAAPKPSGKKSYSVQSVQSPIQIPVSPYLDEQGRVVECYVNNDGTTGCGAISICQEYNLASYEEVTCARRRDAILKEQGGQMGRWQGGTIPNLFGGGNLPPVPPGAVRKKFSIGSLTKFAINDSSGRVIASGGGNLLGQAGTNLKVSSGKIWVPNANGVRVVSHKAGDVTDSRGKVIASGGGNLIGEAGTNFVPTSGGNIVFKAPGWQIIDSNGNVIASGGGNVIASGGGNVIASGGGNVIASGGGNLIGEAGTNLIGQAGTNLIGEAGTNIVPVGNAYGLAITAGTLSFNLRDALPSALTSFMELSFTGSLDTQVLSSDSFAIKAGASAKRKKGKKKRKPVVVARAHVNARKPGVYPVTMKLTRKGKKLLKKLRKTGKRARFALQTTLRPKKGKAVKSKRKLSVKPRKAKRKAHRERKRR
jgi:hypothetical protein